MLHLPCPFLLDFMSFHFVLTWIHLQLEVAGKSALNLGTNVIYFKSFKTAIKFPILVSFVCAHVLLSI